ncbi:MAG: TlpA family protein disulfide reductase [Spirochaetaceae bacterium]|nr:TlpA family protein disulfide reductase [Spirochaetaceae bacterium]
MKFFSRFFFILTTTIILLVFTTCSRTSGPPDSEILRDLGFRPIPEGSEFPDISFTDTGNQTHSLGEFKGSVILLNFWASWCPPCRAEMPSMGHLAEELKNSDFVMIPVNVQEPLELVESFVTEFEIGFPVYLDINADAARAIGVSGLPTSILIDRDGSAVAVVTGAIEWDDDELISMMRGWTR